VKHTSQVVESKRRTPRQTRAKETLEVVLEAAAQILQKHGRDHFNTNFIAERAGISIGTLYQYFPNKQAILIEIARREIARDHEAVRNALTHAFADPSVDPARASVRALIASQRKQTKVRRAALDAIAAEGLSHLGLESQPALQQITELVANNRGKLFSQAAKQPSPIMLFVASRAVLGVIRAAVVENTQLLQSQEFEDELVRLIRQYFS
jgi:AcrR family transcriptional regulator